MEKSTVHNPPVRITDLARLKEQGWSVTCTSSFEVYPVEFVHRDNRFQAYIFSCRFSGAVDGREYSFRKCYARGCPHNLCPHVSQAVMIANRYLQRDYQKLKSAGIPLEEKTFSLEDMLVKFRDFQDDYGAPLTINDYASRAKEGEDVNVDVALEYVPAVEHLEYHQRNLQVFLMADFTIQSREETHRCQRCFACYPADREMDEKPRQMRVANDRLDLLYQEFDQGSVQYTRQYFS